MAEASPAPPGVVIHHSPASSGLYIGSPSLCVAPDGSYLASHDLFGPKSREFELASGRLYQSTDKGATWRHLRDFQGFFWTGLFTHRGAVYLMGTDRHHGRVVIRRSADSGKTWSDAVVIADGQWHTAPVPVITHGGRLWRAIEDAHTSDKWGERYRARMMSAPEDGDLMNAKNWTISNALARDPAWLGGDFQAWLEGNAVAAPDGRLVDVLRVDTPRFPEKAAIVEISKDGAAATFDPGKDIIFMPGGAKKFTIRKDPAGPGYWTLASIVPESQQGPAKPAGIRNTLALLFSKDLRKWDIRCVLLHHPDVAKHGFQYVDWLFDGSDLIATCRTAWDDDDGGARNNHDANFLTFHRWRNFRALSRKEDVPVPDSSPKVHETSSLSIKGRLFEIAPLRNGEKAFSNRDYRWREIPGEFSNRSFTRTEGGGRQSFEITAKSDTIFRIATATDQKPVDLTGWDDERKGFSYDDSRETKVHVFSRPLKRGGFLRLPAGNWTGSMLILEN